MMTNVPAPPGVAAPSNLLEGRRVVVTGAAQGIGAAIARRFAAQGARLALLDRSIDVCRAVANEIGGVAVEVDLGDPASAVESTTRAIDELGGAV